jgi:hypothetical protein
MTGTDPTMVRDLVSAKKYMKELADSFTFRRFVKENAPFGAPLTELNINHVAGVMQQLCMNLAGEYKTGRFSSSIARGDWAEAIRAADNINKVYISVYVAFIDQHVPPILIK